MKEDYDWERESDFVEEIVCKHIKNRGGSKGKGKVCQEDRDSCILMMSLWLNDWRGKGS